MEFKLFVPEPRKQYSIDSTAYHSLVGGLSCAGVVLSVHQRMRHWEEFHHGLRNDEPSEADSVSDLIADEHSRMPTCFKVKEPSAKSIAMEYKTKCHMLQSMGEAQIL